MAKEKIFVCFKKYIKFARNKKTAREASVEGGTLKNP